jgi:hypothetical protein
LVSEEVQYLPAGGVGQELGHLGVLDDEGFSAHCIATVMCSGLIYFTNKVCMPEDVWGYFFWPRFRIFLPAPVLPL